MNKKTLIIVLSSFFLLICCGIVVAGFIFIPKILNTIPGITNPTTCQISDCHGMDIKCGNNPPPMCTMEYQIGDGCRQFATCSQNAATCTFNPSTEFTQCKTCVEECIETYKSEDEIMDKLSCVETCSFLGSVGVDDSTKIANPSASYCSNLGYEYLGETEICKFDNLTSCDAWDFYKGKCMKENSYCEQSGNTLSSVRESTSTSVYEYALCTFDDGSVCAEEENFRNNCTKGQCSEWKVEQGGCVM